jgi:hypothetical protein
LPDPNQNTVRAVVLAAVPPTSPTPLLRALVLDADGVAAPRAGGTTGWSDDDGQTARPLHPFGTCLFYSIVYSDTAIELMGTTRAADAFPPFPLFSAAAINDTNWAYTWVFEGQCSSVVHVI